MIHLHARFGNSPRGNCDSGSCRTKPTPGSVDLNSTFGPLSKRGQTDLSPVAFQFAGAVLLTGCHQPVPFADSHQGATWLQQSLDQGRRRVKKQSLERKLDLISLNASLENPLAAVPVRRYLIKEEVNK